MKKSLIIGAAMLLSACASQAPRYYQLPSNTALIATPVAVEKSDGVKIVPQNIWVAPIQVAHYLNNAGINYQVDDVSYVMATKHLWASPLSQQLQVKLQSQLSALMPQAIISSRSLNANQTVINVRVDSFHGRYDGTAVIAGETTIEKKGNVIKQPFSIVLAQQKDGYPELVKTLGAGWLQMANQLTKQLNIL